MSDERSPSDERALLHEPSLPDEPSLWEVMAADPAIPVDPATLRMVIRDQRRPSRALLYPWVRVLSRVAVTVIVLLKRVVPIRFSAHATMDRLCLWFLRRFVSPDAVTLLIRHFIIETNLLSFCVRNTGVPAGADPVLRPVTLADLGNRAVIEHDLNVYRVLRALGGAGVLSGVGVPGGAGALRGAGVLGHGQAGHARLDFGMLGVPAIDPEPRTRRLLNLDIQTALCLMNIPFAFCLTPAEYQRAVHSLRLDTSLLTVLAEVTGDGTFLNWLGSSLPVRVDSNVDVPVRVYEHAVLCEHAHARLCHLRDAAAGPAVIRPHVVQSHAGAVGGQRFR
jgi:hypothetical protein